MAFSLSFSLLKPGRDPARLQEKTVNWTSPIHQQGTMKFVEISLIISIPNHTERTRQRTRQSTFPISALINSRPALSARPFLIPFRRKISHQLPRVALTNRLSGGQIQGSDLFSSSFDFQMLLFSSFVWLPNPFSKSSLSPSFPLFSFSKLF